MEKLSRRERQIMDVLYERGRATAAEILAALPDPPSYSAVRALIKVLEGLAIPGRARQPAVWLPLSSSDIEHDQSEVRRILGLVGGDRAVHGARARRKIFLEHFAKIVSRSRPSVISSSKLA